ncbi:MAG TPA: choice-of-anchor D domain-containing protein [Bryobacteraceae bacterium]|nr:choice-of-anchor D domain-containing protein [Bryobacteraceae bacterium]
MRPSWSWIRRRIGRGAVLLAALAVPSFAQQSNFTFSYVLAVNQNTVPVQPGGIIAFPATPLNSVSQAALNITNTGGPAEVQNVSISSGSAFSLQGLPAFPFLVNTQQTLQVLIRYQPSGASTDTGQIQVSLGQQGAQITFGLQGTLSAAKLVYQLTENGQTATVTPGSAITLPDTNVGQSSSANLTVENTGNSSTTIGSIILNGQNFALSGTPVLPDTLGPNASFTFKITFTPTQAAVVQASLAIGSDSFTLTGRGLGANLAFAYTMAGTTATLGTGDSVVFTPAMVTQSESAQFTISNTGTVAANIFNIGIVQASSPFSVSGLPPLPVNIAPNAQASFTITFAPTTVGFTTGTLQVGNTTIGLIGSGTAPPALPAYTFSGPTGDVAAMSQPSVGLKLSKPYPAAVSGTLTITISSDLTVDPAVQFSTGGRTITFVIPANTTEAIFAGQGPQIQLQTGTVESTITLTPTFATQAGGINLTPASPATLQFSVAGAAPTLISVQVGSTTSNSFVLTLVGFTTTRSLTTIAVQFTAAAGFKISATPVNIDLSHVATAWFVSTASVAFGGQFQVTVPFTLNGTVATGQTLIGSLAGVTATIANSTGTSNSVQANF